jgi:hypothetical protein
MNKQPKFLGCSCCVGALIILLDCVSPGHAGNSDTRRAPSLLPSRFLSVNRAQIVGPDQVPVRIASVGLTGMNVVGGRLQLEGPFHGIEGHVGAMKTMGFNCVRVDWILMSENVAPVWIDEMGSSMISPTSKEWGTTLLPYMNGKAPAGPVFTGAQQPVSGDWWVWGYLTGQNPNGCVGKDGKVRPEQAPFIDQMLFRPEPHL